MWPLSSRDDGGRGKALVAGLLKKNFFAASLIPSSIQFSCCGVDGWTDYVRNTAQRQVKCLKNSLFYKICLKKKQKKHFFLNSYVCLKKGPKCELSS